VRIIKRHHAHLTVDIDGRILVIDPGMFSPTAAEDGVEAVVVTHEHTDHWTHEHLTAIRARNPDVRIFGPRALAEAAPDVPVVVIGAGDAVDAGPFDLRFVGGEHAAIHPTLFPASTNVGVVVNGDLYHPGDSYTVPDQPCASVAVPIAGPWHKVAESIDWISQLQPAKAFNLHDDTLSEAGQRMNNDIMARVVSAGGGTYTALAIGDSIEV